MKKFLSILLCTILFGCNSGINGGADNSNQNQDEPQNNTANKVLSLSNVATIPTAADQQSSATLLLTNNTGVVVHGVTVSFAGGDYSGASIVSKCDGDLPIGQSCQISLRLPARLQQGSFVLNATGNSAKGQYSAKQLITYANVVEIKGIEAGEFNDQVIAASGNKVTLAIPFRKVGNYQVRARVDSSGDNDPVNETICNSDNSQCTELVSITPHNDNEINVTFLNNNDILTTVSTAVIMNAIGNLVTPANNVIISKSDGVTPASIQLLNNGYTAINNIRFSSSNPAFIFNTSSCNTIAANGSCTATITANSKVNGFGSVTVMYDTTSSTGQVYQNKTTTFNASYLAEEGAAGLGLTVSGDSFSNNWVGESRNAYLTIKNSGAIRIDSINITSVVSQNANVSVSGYGATACALDGTQSLEPNTSCVVKVTYAPSKSEAGNLIINFSGKYLDSRDISGSGSVSVLSDVVNLDYNSNFRVVYLMTGSSQNGVTRCNLTNDGRSLTDCSVTGVSGSNNNSTVLSNTGVLGFSSFMSNDGLLNAYVGATKSSSSDFAKCNASESGLLSNCTSVMSVSGSAMNGVSGQNIQNTIANINGKNYLYIAMSDSGRMINKCLVNESNGNLSGCVSQAAKFSNINSGFYSIVISGNYAYTTRFNGTQAILAVCSVNQSTGNFDTCTETVDTYGRAIYSPVIKTLGSVKYIFYTIRNETNTPMIRRCSINPANGLLNNDCASFTVPEILAGSGLTLLTTSGTDYLYYGKSTTNNVYRAQLNADGTITNPEQIFTSGTLLTGTQYLSALVEYPRVKIAYAPSTNVYYPNNTYTESLYIAANVKAIKNTSVTLTAPSGITVSPTTINFTASTTRVPVSISVASNVVAGTYTVTGVSSDGTIVPDFTINVVRPQIASYMPVTGRGISNNLSTGLNTRYSSFANIIFTRPMNIASGTINGLKLQYSSDNSTFYDVTSPYSWNVTADKKTAYLVINGTNLGNGNYYRIMVDKSLLKDTNGNSISLVSGYEELTRFRAALKIYITTALFSGDLGGLGGADDKCNSTSNGKPDDGERYSAVLAANKYSGGTAQRFPGTNWVLERSMGYYRSNGSGLVLFGITDDFGRLNNIQNAFYNGKTPWSGFNGSDWAIAATGGDNWACNNWTVGSSSWSVEAYYANLNDAGSGWIRGGNVNCRELREIICAQQVN